MKIALGCDHAGFALKETVLRVLQTAKHEVIDCGTCSCERTDYPDYAFAVCQQITTGKAERGILICGSGVGMCVTANKVKTIRACVCHDSYSARQAVEHDDLNVLCLGARIIGPALAEELVTQFVNASLNVEPRHAARRGKVQAWEDAHFK